MRGIFEHFKLTLALNFKNRQALIYGYMVPFFFLIAFGSLYRNMTPPLIGQLGQLLTISVLGGCCFGMPTAMVAERERGIWRRFRLLPVATRSLVISTMAARFLIVLSAAVMQVALAKLMYGMPMPEHPSQMFVAFTCVTFAFLGLGLTIAMLADTVPAVQALGQMIFLPMIIIGGVGVPLTALPEWCQHAAAFLPGIYAVDALQACGSGNGLAETYFDLAALIVIGIAACFAGAMMFRWDAQEKPPTRQRAWVFAALIVWISVGLTAEATGHVTTGIHFLVTTHPATQNAAGGSDDSGWTAITREQMENFPFKDLPKDNGQVAPLAASFDNLNDAGKQHIAEFRTQLAAWAPGKDPSLPRRVRNLLDVAAVADIIIDTYEASDAMVVFETLKADIPKEDLEKVLTWIALHPADQNAITKMPELGLKGVKEEAGKSEIKGRVEIYALKYLGRLIGKLP